jgi:hypothetical protein
MPTLLRLFSGEAALRIYVPGLANVSLEVRAAVEMEWPASYANETAFSGRLRGKVGTVRVMLKIQMPAEAANAAIQQGRLVKVLSSTLERLKPEAAYFTAMDGDRGGYFVFDLQHPSDIPVICEPFFMELNAKCELAPVMTAEDVQAGLAKAFPAAKV